MSSTNNFTPSTIYNSLPSELQNVIIPTKVVSGHGSTSGETNFETQDNLYLLNAQEVCEKYEYDSSVGTSKQLDYYKLQNNNSAIKQYNGSNSYWWLRSANSASIYHFLSVNNTCRLDVTITQNGVSPAFRIA